MKKPNVAASSYLNAAPLCYSFVSGSQVGRCRFLSDAAPARCSEMLRTGEADAALIPVIEYQRIEGLKIARGACVSSKKRVRSVVLASRVPIDSIRSVALDTSSRTSAALIQIILAQFYQLKARFTPAPPRIDEMLASNDAALIIGDPAMLIDQSSLRIYDLAEEWNKHTGLPFVFAFWAIRNESASMFGNVMPDNVNFEEAKEEGTAHIGDIAARYARDLELPKSELVNYLTENISYDLDDENLEGLRLYYRLAAECRLIETPRELEYSI